MAPVEPRTRDKVRLDRDFTELYRAHLRDVYSYAYYRIGNHHDAEDITEQTFLQAYRHFERAQRESHGRPLRPWLIRIAHNLAANYYRDRSRKPQTNLEDAGVLADLHDTEDLVEGREEVQQVLAGVAKLPEDRRDALIMRFALDMDNREIARALGRSDGATKVLIHRAIKQLEEELSGRMSEARFDVEALLRSALTPVEPPEALSDRLERHLTELTDLAAEELADWELGAMRDPRNWARPAAAAVVGAGRRRAGARPRSPAVEEEAGGGLKALERSVRGVASDLEKRVRRG